MTLVNTPASACATASSACSCVRSASSSARKSTTPAIPRPRDRRGAGALARLIGQPHQPLLLFAIVDECVLGLLDRTQDDLFEFRNRFARRAFGAAQPGARAADIERRPTERRRHRPRARVGGVEEAAASGQQTKESGDADLRKESAAATPSRPVADASRRSAARTSGRRRSSDPGSPMASAFVSGG